jgi:hypothetical protein
MTARMASIPWGRLRSGARPTAADVPGLLTALATGPDDRRRAAIREELDEHLAPDGLLFEATPFAVPFLVELARNGARPEEAFVAQLILEGIAYGDPHADEIAAGNTRLFRQVGRELTAATEFLYRQAASAEPALRGQAVALLAPIDGRSVRFRELLAGFDVRTEHPLVVEEIRGAEEYLADVRDGERPPLPVRPEDVVAQLRAAGDRETARWAASDVAHEAVDDAVAVTPGSAPRVVAEVRRLVEDGLPWRADAFAVLNYVLDHAHVYRDLRAGVRTYRGEWDWGVAEEEAVEEALSGFDRVVRDLLDDPDPETRSLAALTLARISGEPAADRELLGMLAEAEPDERVCACLAEARLRLAGPEAGDRPWRWPAEEI